jgi:hypothetical protein
MDLNGDINDTQACFNFLGQVWGRGIGAGEICAASPVNNMQIAMTFTAGLWRLPPEYLSQRADIGAAVVFRAYFPCRQAAASVPKPAPAPSASALTALVSSVQRTALVTAAVNNAPSTSDMPRRSNSSRSASSRAFELGDLRLECAEPIGEVLRRQVVKRGDGSDIRDSLGHGFTSGSGVRPGGVLEPPPLGCLQYRRYRQALRLSISVISVISRTW